MSGNMSLFKSVLSLGTVNVLGLLINIVCMPIILTSLGNSVYGIYVYLFIQCQLLSLVVTFGFDIFAVTEVKGNIKLANRLIFPITIIRITLYLISAIVVYFFVLYNMNDVDIKLLILFIISMFPTCFNFSWYFQSIEKMEFIALSNLAGKLLYLIFVLLPIDKDITYFVIIFLASNYVTAIIYMYIVFIKMNVRVSFHAIGVKAIFRKSFSLFSYQLLVGVIPSVNSSLANGFGGKGLITSFDIFNKVSSVVNVFTGVIVQALYPKIVKRNSLNDALGIAVGYISSMFIFISSLCFLFWSLSAHIDSLLYDFLGFHIDGGAKLIIISLIFSFFCSVNSMLSRVLIFSNNIKIVNFSTFLALISAITLTPLLLNFEPFYGLFFGMMLSQIVMSVFFIVVLVFKIRSVQLV